MALEINAQYARFVQFAQQQENAATSKAIARAGEEDVALGGRAITLATGDKVAPWFKRSQDNKDANNAVRALFRQAIVDNVLQSGEMIALDPDGRAAQMQIGGGRSWEFNVAFEQDGTLSIACKLVISNLSSLTIPGGNGIEDYDTDDINPATKVEMDLTLKIKADEFTRLASLDYTACDLGAIDRMSADPNVTDPHSKYGQALGEEFALKTANSKVTCTSSCKITVA